MQGRADSFKIGVNRKKILPVLTICMLVITGCIGFFIHLQPMVNATVAPTEDINSNVMSRESYAFQPELYPNDGLIYYAGGYITAPIADIYVLNITWNSTTYEFDVISDTDTTYNLPSARFGGGWFYHDPTSRFFYLGGRSATSVEDDIYNFVPGVGTGSNGTMVRALVDFGGCYDPNRDLYWIVGGKTTTAVGDAVSNISYYNASTGDYVDVGNLDYALAECGACYDNVTNTIYIAGGRNTTGYDVSDVFYINVSTIGSPVVNKCTDMPGSRYNGAMFFNYSSSENNSCYIVAGTDRVGTTTTNPAYELYKVDTGNHSTWWVTNLSNSHADPHIIVTNDTVNGFHISGGRYWTTTPVTHDNVTSLFWNTTGGGGGGDAEISVSCSGLSGPIGGNNTHINFVTTNDSKTNVDSDEWLHVTYDADSGNASITELHILWNASIGGQVASLDNLHMCIWTVAGEPTNLNYNQSSWSYVDQFTTGNSGNITVNSSDWSGAVGESIGYGESVYFMFRIDSLGSLAIGSYSNSASSHKVYITGQT